jgi:hypothetical protein
MNNVQRIRHSLPISPEITEAANDLAVSIGKAIDAAKAAGLPQGLIVALLHGQAHSETAKMVAG